jgi:hypothetical protein
VIARLGTLLAILASLVVLVCAQPAAAHGRDGGKTQVFDNVYVAPGETVAGDVDAVFGNVEVAGTVTGDCNTVFGKCTVDDGGRVGGKINGVDNDVVRAFVPWALLHDRDGFGALADQDRRLIGKLFGSVIVLLIFLVFPLRMRVALDRVERHPALSAAAGAIAATLVVPIAIVLLVSVIGIPLILLEIVGLVVFVWIGTGAIALLVGRRLCELVVSSSTPSPLVALILGLVVVSAAEIMPFVGWAVTALVWLVGLGSAILSFFRTTLLDSALHRSPVGGPPMRRWG